MRVTHQPSPWMGDYGNFVIKATIPGTNSNQKDEFSGYSPDKSTFSSHLFQTSLYAYSTEYDSLNIAFTGTNHGGILQANFPKPVENAADIGWMVGLILGGFL